MSLFGVSTTHSTESLIWLQLKNLSRKKKINLFLVLNSLCFCLFVFLSFFPSVFSNVSVFLSCILSFKMWFFISISISPQKVSKCRMNYFVYKTILSVFLSVSLSVYLSICLSVYLSICLSVYLSICLSVYLSICLSVFLSLFEIFCVKQFFGPKKRSVDRMLKQAQNICFSVFLPGLTDCCLSVFFSFLSCCLFSVFLSVFLFSVFLSVFLFSVFLSCLSVVCCLSIFSSFPSCFHSFSLSVLM